MQTCLAGMCVLPANRALQVTMGRKKSVQEDCTHVMTSAEKQGEREILSCEHVHCTEQDY